MNIGVFLLIEPFASVERQLQRAKAMGFTHADITDTNACWEPPAFRPRSAWTRIRSRSDACSSLTTAIGSACSIRRPSDTGFPVNPNGNMPAGQRASKNTRSATPNNCWANTSGTNRIRPVARGRLGRSCPTAGDCSICTETFGNGARTSGTTLTKAHRLMAAPSLRMQQAASASPGAVAGLTMPATAGVPAAAGGTLSSATTTWVFGSCLPRGSTSDIRRFP